MPGSDLQDRTIRSKRDGCARARKFSPYRRAVGAQFPPTPAKRTWPLRQARNGAEGNDDAGHDRQVRRRAYFVPGRTTEAGARELKIARNTVRAVAGSSESTPRAQ